MGVSSDEIARQLLDVVPLVMRTIRSEMRSRRTPGLNVPQFRALMYLNRNPGVALLDLAAHLGLTPPTVSKMVDGLVEARLVRRQASTADRRRVLLELTSQGRVMLAQAHDGTQARLAEIVSGLTPAEGEMVLQALACLQAAFGAGSVRGAPEAN